MKKVCRRFSLRSSIRYEKLHFTCEWAPKHRQTWARATFSLMFERCSQLWKWKNNRGNSKIHPEKNIMKIINFPSQLLQIGWCIFITRKCYKLKLFIFNASRKKHFHPNVHATLLFDIVSAFSILYGLRRKEFCFYYVDVSPHTSSSEIQKTEYSQHFPVTCRFVCNFSQVNAIILRISPRVKKW